MAFLRFLLIIPRRVFRISLFYRFFTRLSIFEKIFLFPSFAQLHESSIHHFFLSFWIIFLLRSPKKKFVIFQRNQNTVASFSIFSVYWLSFLYYLFLHFSGRESLETLFYFFDIFFSCCVAEQNDEKKRTCYAITVIMVSIYNILIKSRGPLASAFLHCLENAERGVSAADFIEL